ncbi:MAG: hypothetical protein U9O78_03455 [Patescibacteria group bacterium]|nr:hypothetical protein [Patescibacteria group bacterium]
MKVKLKTERQFLRRNFSNLRKFLLGRGRKHVVVRKKAKNRPLTILSHPTIIFENSSDIFENYSEGRSGNLFKKFGFFKNKRKKPKKSIYNNFFVKWGLNLFVFVPLLVLGVIFVPTIYHLFFSAETVNQASLATHDEIKSDVKEDETKEKIEKIASQSGEVKKVYLPWKDSDLPEGDWLIVPRIGVNSALQKTKDPEAALATGIWWAHDFGGPGDFDKPMIVAAHRYGWQWWWKSDYWRYHSFYYLPETKPGDIVEIISNQRKWLYEIYAGEQGVEITDYEADLILYTCKHLNSPVRYFRYARMVLPRAEENL